MPSSRPLDVPGCARNEVDSEELAGRLEAGGFRLVDDPADADTVVVNTCGFVEAAKKDSVDTLLEAADLKQTGQTRPSWPWAAWPSATARTSPSRCPRPTRCSASTTTPTSRPGCGRSSRGRPTGRTPRRTGAAAADLPGRARRLHVSRARPRSARDRPPTGRRDRRGRRGDRPRAVRRRLDGGPMAAAQAGQRLRPALLVLRDPELPRLVRQPPPQRRAARGALAGRAGRPRAVPGQRELHVLRQGPRRPPAARDPAARAGRGRRRRPGAGVLPAARRDPSRA